MLVFFYLTRPFLLPFCSQGRLPEYATQLTATKPFKKNKHSLVQIKLILWLVVVSLLTKSAVLNLRLTSQSPVTEMYAECVPELQVT